MNTVQKWLAEKELIMPSENHPPSEIGLIMYKVRRAVSDKTRRLTGKIADGIKHQYHLMTNRGYAFDYWDGIREAKKDKERLAKWKEDGYDPSEEIGSQWDILDFEVQARIERDYSTRKFEKGDAKEMPLASIVEAAREDEFAWDTNFKRDELNERYHARKAAWQAQGYDYDADRQILQKLGEIRKNAYREARVKQAEELTAKVNDGTLNAWDMQRALNEEDLHCRVLGEEPSLNEQISGVYSESAPFVDVAEFYESHPETQIVHGITGRINPTNNKAIRLEKGKNWKDIFDYLIREKPVVSCSAVNLASSISRFYSPMGVLIGKGKIYDAALGDNATVAFSPEMRLGYDGIKGQEQIRGDLGQLVNKINPVQNGNYNEVTVGQPEIKGIFYALNSPNSTNLSFASVPIWEVAGYASNRGLPFFIFREGEGFTQVNPEDYLVKPELVGVGAA